MTDLAGLAVQTKRGFTNTESHFRIPLLRL